MGCEIGVRILFKAFSEDLN